MMDERHKAMAAELTARGLIVGTRDPRRNTAFTGHFMVAEPAPLEALPTSDGGEFWCVVGDDLGFLVRTAFDFFVTAEMGEP